MTPEQRRLRALKAAHTRWSKSGAREQQAEAARAAMYARWADQVDPGRVLPPDERAKLIRSAARRQAAEMNAAKAAKTAGSAGKTPDASTGQRPALRLVR